MFALTPRRLTAAALVVLSVLLWLHAATDDTVPVLVAAHPIAAGVGLSAADVRVVRAPPHLRPESAFSDPGAATGRVLAVGAATGEPITETRLLGSSAIGEAKAAVAIRLAEPGVARLLRPGARVDVISAVQTADENERGPLILARDATVMATPSDRDRDAGDRGSLVLIALPRDSAAQVASISLRRPVTVTLR